MTNYQGALQNFPLALLISASLANAKVSNEDCNGWTILIVFIGHCNKSTTTFHYKLARLLKFQNIACKRQYYHRLYTYCDDYMKDFFNVSRKRLNLGELVYSVLSWQNNTGLFEVVVSSQMEAPGNKKIIFNFRNYLEMLILK